MVDKEILKIIEGKYRKKYAAKYGIEHLINQYHGLPWNDKKSEEVYRICLQKNITWEKYYKIDKRTNVIY